MKPSSIAIRPFAGFAPPGSEQSGNIVDQLIRERAPGLSASPLGRWFMRAVLYPLLDYETAVALAHRLEAQDGQTVMRTLEEFLAQRLVVSGLEHVPAAGRVIVVANHPTGLADGIAAYSALRRARPDLWVLANADAIRAVPGLADVIVPVEWVPDKRSHSKTKEMLQATSRVMAREQALVIFPSGRLSYFSWRGLTERPWQATVVALARKFEAPILPIRLVARNSALFYAFSKISNELRDITLFHELLNKRGRLYEVQIAAPIGTDELPGDPAEAVTRLQDYVQHGLCNRAELWPSRPPAPRPLLAPSR